MPKNQGDDQPVSGENIPGRDFPDQRIAADEQDQAEGRRASMLTQDNMFMGPHDQVMDDHEPGHGRRQNDAVRDQDREADGG